MVHTSVVHPPNFTVMEIAGAWTPPSPVPNPRQWACEGLGARNLMTDLMPHMCLCDSGHLLERSDWCAHQEALSIPCHTSGAHPRRGQDLEGFLVICHPVGGSLVPQDSPHVTPSGVEWVGGDWARPMKAFKNQLVLAGAAGQGCRAFLGGLNNGIGWLCKSLLSTDAY